MLRPARSLALAAALAAALLGSEARGDSPLDESQAAARERGEQASPIRDSALVFDQSVTTQTLGVGEAPQSYVPFYEWWISFRPRYHFSDKVYAWVRFDYYKEFTNTANGRTDLREDSLGDTWTSLVYETPVPAISPGTSVNVGLRTLWPTSKASRDQGIYVNAGVTAGAKQRILLRDESARFFTEARLALSGWYSHNFSEATTGVNGSLDYVRQDTEGQSILSDQLSGTMIVNHQLLTGADGALQITPKLSLRLQMILIQAWHYAPPGDVTVSVAGGGTATVPRNSDAPNYTLATWFISTLDYDLLDELTLTLGYMNLENALSYQGQDRTLFGSDNVFWSPEARFFFDLRANLEPIWNDLSARR